MTDSNITLTTICAPSDDIVAREIEGEIIIVPLASGIGDTDDELYTLNPTGQAIWQKLDGQRTLKDIMAARSSSLAPTARTKGAMCRRSMKTCWASWSVSHAMASQCRSSRRHTRGFCAVTTPCASR